MLLFYDERGSVMIPINSNGSSSFVSAKCKFAAISWLLVFLLHLNKKKKKRRWRLEVHRWLCGSREKVLPLNGCRMQVDGADDDGQKSALLHGGVYKNKAAIKARRYWWVHWDATACGLAMILGFSLKFEWGISQSEDIEQIITSLLIW